MKKRNHSEFEIQLATVLKHQDQELATIQFPTMDTAVTISETELLLRQIGQQPTPQEKVEKETSKKTMVVPTWAELVAEAEKSVGKQNAIEDLFTKEELQKNEQAIKMLNKEFNSLHCLDAFDVSIAAIGGIVGAAFDILLVGIPEKSKTGLTAGPLSNYIRDYFDRQFPEEEMKKLANAKISKVPYDAQDNRHTTIYVEGLSAYYHRLLQLGHDPLLGFFFGVSDILSGKMTTIDKTGKVVSQTMDVYSDRTEVEIFKALGRQVRHLKSDVTTSMGLPAPLLSLFILLQFGSIGEEEQTIAEIVQGMYYQGYDFIHFCSMSVSTMLVEVIVRIGYALKRIKEGHSIKESIPFSLDRSVHPKLATMLFIGHSAAAAANAGKVYFTKNPVAINYTEWVAFAHRAYDQLKWSILEKSIRRQAYVEGRLNEELKEVFKEAEATFDAFSKDYIVIFHE